MMPTTGRRETEVHRVAQGIFETNPDWVTFYREILGLQGIVRQKYPTRKALAKFERTDTYRQIQQMLATLMARKPPKKPAEAEKAEAGRPDETALGREAETGVEAEVETAEQMKVVTIRLPQSLHETLRVEAFENRTSMNKLCISKLMQLIDSEIVPSEI